ncbi:hypothetical protein [Aquimarina sp. Aq107]|uniref:hypothetical protein n=1 Tax=Aquimarina sp. Aq107 TaxID=1191912 RepID=UPI000D560B90|nr:hypothetical protein [Aquimarina sp. Aq107]
MKKSISLYVLLGILFLTFISCKNDDDATTSSQELMNETIAILNGGSSKTWKITQATLINGSIELDISENFNVKDDEFIFSRIALKDSLVWRKGFDIKTNVSNIQETLLDKYVSSISGEFSILEGSNNTVELDFISATFEVTEDDNINATITNEDDSILRFTLIEKKQEDYVTVPQTGLNFSNLFSFESDAVRGSAPGMIGSYSDDSFFIATRETDADGLNNPERVLKFDPNTNTMTEKLFPQTDYVSKQLHIVDNKLIVLGGQYVNTYDLDISQNPVSISHGKQLSRFGISVLDDDIYVIGGDLNDTESDKIFKWNLESETLAEFATLPESRSGARGTIVNDHLYVFGGSEELFGLQSSNKIFKINIANPQLIETFEMNKAINFTYVQKYQHLIYVAGQIRFIDNNNELQTQATIGVLNTLNNSYQELATNLVSNTGEETIHQMCIFNDKMYLIYGAEGIDNGGQYPEWDVLTANLN